MLALLPSSLGLLVIPPAPGTLPALNTLQHTLRTRAEEATSAGVIFPVIDGHSLDVTTLLADENGKWISASFDELAALAIPFILVALLFILFQLAKLFASAF